MKKITIEVVTTKELYIPELMVDEGEGEGRDTCDLFKTIDCNSEPCSKCILSSDNRQHLITFINQAAK